MSWRFEDIELEGDTVQVILLHDIHRIAIVADIAFPGPDVAVLSGLHVQGAGSNVLGTRALLGLARWAREFLNVRELRVEGAVRTSGASPGRLPAGLVFR